MDISNSLLATGIKLPVPIPKNQDQAQSRPGSSFPLATENNRNATPRTERPFTVNQADLVRKAEAVQSARIQRDDALADAPLKGQQAINAYQQTVDASRQYQEGELVGIDLYV